MDSKQAAAQAQSLEAVKRELQRVNRTLRQLTRVRARGTIRYHPAEIGSASIRAILAVRRLRDECFGAAVGDHGWSVLLEAYAARLDGRQSPMTGLGLAAGIARSTAHRRVAWLLDRGLLVRHPNPGNRRTAFVAPSDEAADRIAAYLAAAARISPLGA
jgi:hypothetical protein